LEEQQYFLIKIVIENYETMNY